MGDAGDKRIRVMVVDDHDLVRQGIAALVNMGGDMVVVAEATDGVSAVHTFREHVPDVTLMDLRMPRRSGLEAMALLRLEFPAARFIVLTTYDGDDDVYRALAAGARGYLLKGARHDELIDMIRAVHAGGRRVPPDLAERALRRLGEPDLSDREKDILARIVAGMSNKQIAAELAISEKTVKGHVTRLMAKLNVTARTQAAVVAIQRGLVKL